MLGLTRTSVQCRAPAQLRAGASSCRVAPRTVVRAVDVEAKADTKSKKAKQEEFSDEPDFGPSTAQVQSFLNTLCDETTIAQVEVKLGSFHLKVTRSLESGSAAAGPAPAPAPVAAPEPVAPAPVVLMTSEGVTAEESIDEALLYITSPKVGIFRRGKYAAGKRVGKGDMVKDGDTLRSGQTVAFVEQLGTFVEIKTPQGGEVVKFRVQEGEPVEYGQVVCDIAPTFSFASPAS